MKDKNYIGCSDEVAANTVASVACDSTNTFKSLIRQITIDNVIMHPKTKQQITDILLEHERQFIEVNPDYKYDNYRYEDGKHGERTIFFNV